MMMRGIIIWKWRLLTVIMIISWSWSPCEGVVERPLWWQGSSSSNQQEKEKVVKRIHILVVVCLPSRLRKVSPCCFLSLCVLGRFGEIERIGDRMLLFCVKVAAGSSCTENRRKEKTRILLATEQQHIYILPSFLLFSRVVYECPCGFRLLDSSCLSLFQWCSLSLSLSFLLHACFCTYNFCKVYDRWYAKKWENTREYGGGVKSSD